MDNQNRSQDTNQPQAAHQQIQAELQSQPQSPQNMPWQQPTKKNNKKKIILIVVIAILVLLAGAGIGYSLVLLKDNDSLNVKVSSLESQLEAEQTRQPDIIEEEDADVAVEANIINIYELGVALNVPESLKDLSYSYSVAVFGSGETHEIVTFSTKAITDNYSSVGDCSPAVGPLGSLTKRPGQAGGSGALVKQFNDYHLVFVLPETVDCAGPGEKADIQEASVALTAVIDSLE